MRLASLQAGPFRTRLSISEHLGESAGGGSPRKWEVRFGWVWAGRCQVSYMIYIGYKPQGRSHWRAVACEPSGRMSGTRGPSLVAAFALVAAAGRPGDSCRHGQCRRNVRRDAGCGDTGRALTRGAASTEPARSWPRRRQPPRQPALPASSASASIAASANAETGRWLCLASRHGPRATLGLAVRSSRGRRQKKDTQRTGIWPCSGDETVNPDGQQRGDGPS